MLRIAGDTDLARVQENDLREERAYSLCREKIESRGLDMKLVSAHYLLDEQKILFLFTAENRVDFRDLVKDLVTAFKMRIELRQIGVRDEARVVGGLGICGRALCCNAITDRSAPGLHQDGEGAEPDPELHEDFRSLRKAPVLSFLRVRRIQGGPPGPARNGGTGAF